ncbi:hypothetical protein [uncultured Sphingomonas sp.]|uniref:hypothetical protein n=1 Tax=uncultured Sphingomonas sp. TaxID=158754 RepID=UPI0035CA42A4
MIDETLPDARDLPKLLDVLTDVVMTLDAAGADGYSDVYVHVSGSRDGRHMGDVSFEHGEIWMSTGGSKADVSTYRRADDTTGGRTLLVAQMMHMVWHWRWTTEDMASALGVGARFLDRWMDGDGSSEGAMPAVVTQRARRLLVVEQLRLIAGIGDAAVAAWSGADRRALGGRSIREVLSTDGEVGFRRVLMLMMNAVAAGSHTVH